MSSERIDFTEQVDYEAVPILGEAKLTDDPVKQYLDIIARVPLLNAEQEVEISQRIEAGLYAENLLADNEQDADFAQELEWIADDGRAAKQHMLEANTRLVVSIAKKYTKSGLPFLDLIQEGNIGLVRAVEKFDYQKGYKFSTYATWWVRQAITRGIAEKSRLVRLPVHVAEDLNAVRRAGVHLERELGRKPSENEIADECGYDVDKVINLLEWGRDHISLDTPLGDDGDDSIGTMLADTTIMGTEDEVMEQVESQELRDVLQLLSERDADILISRFGLRGGRTEKLKEVAERWGISVERTRQLERAALMTLRGMSTGDSTFDRHKVEARRQTNLQQPNKKQPAPGVRAQERLNVAENLSKYRGAISIGHQAVLEAFATTASKALAAEALNVSASQFDMQLRLAKQALGSIIEQSS